MPNDRRPMDIRCKTLYTVLCALLMMLFPPFTAHAEETAGTDSVIITFDMSGAPAGTAYVDILGKISPDSEYYTEHNSSNRHNDINCFLHYKSSVSDF